jgi:hypothetical protein
LDRLRCLGRRAAFGIAVAATILGQVADQRIHHCKIDGVKELAADALLRNQAGALKVLQMERQRGRQETDPIANGTGRQPLRAALNQEPVDR